MQAITVSMYGAMLIDLIVCCDGTSWLKELNIALVFTALRSPIEERRIMSRSINGIGIQSSMNRAENPLTRIGSIIAPKSTKNIPMSIE